MYRLTFILLLLSFSSFAQVDSLEHALKYVDNQSDKIDILIELSEELYRQDSLKSSEYASEAIKSYSLLSREAQLQYATKLAYKLYYQRGLDIALSALQSTEHLLKQDSLSAEWFYRKGSIKYRKGNKSDALKEFQK
ncbi:hypothetical protein E1176_07330, partial [Fulvivirga sp. RKSG066]|uniref:hypothetical protein n=1 Tax=Fulvivirga aurantia TaxID=2529383 RepID=UPI0012BBE3C8